MKSLKPASPTDSDLIKDRENSYRYVKALNKADHHITSDKNTKPVAPAKQQRTPLVRPIDSN